MKLYTLRASNYSSIPNDGLKVNLYGFSINSFLSAIYTIGFTIGITFGSLKEGYT